MIPLASSYSFGALTTDTTKNTSGNVSFRLGLVNPGEDELKINFESRGLENGEVVFPDEISLQPSRTASSPREGWISISPNTYVKPRWVEFYVLTEDSSDNSFSVRAEAREPVLTSDTSTSPKIVQVREFGYNLKYREERFSKPEGDKDEDPDFFSFESDEAEENKSEKSKQYVIFGNSSERQAEHGSGGAVITSALLVISLLSIFYLWRSL